MEGGYDGRWPKQRRTRRLGFSVSVFFSSFLFDNNYYFINCFIGNTCQGEAVMTKRARTMYLMSSRWIFNNLTYY